MALYHYAKIHAVWFCNKLSTDVGVLGLADFWPIFRVFDRLDVCAYISQKLNKLGLMFIFPITL